MSTKQVTCRYFLHGVCREGGRCLFSHDPNNSKPSTICKFYQRGVCAYGERCRYDHIKATSRPDDPGLVGGARKPMVLRERVLGDGVYRPPVDGGYRPQTEAVFRPQTDGVYRPNPPDSYRPNPNPADGSYRPNLNPALNPNLNPALNDGGYRPNPHPHPAEGVYRPSPPDGSYRPNPPDCSYRPNPHSAEGVYRPNPEAVFRPNPSPQDGVFRPNPSPQEAVFRPNPSPSDGVFRPNPSPQEAVFRPNPSPSDGAPPPSYVAAIRSGLEAPAQDQAPPPVGPYQLCPYAAAGHCFYGDSCTYLHGDLCEVCRLQVLHPHDQEQRRAHEKMCMVAFEADMEKAFAAQLSQDKVCSICMELVVQKLNPSDRRFGILSSCVHTFCLQCIRQWRCTRNFSNKIIKSCPECRVVSEFVIPSVYWVEDQSEKDRLIHMFKSGVSKKACKYFDQGRGSCPFGGKCLYLHAFPDGTRPEPDRPRKQLGSEGTVRFMNNVRLWDFIEERETRPALEDDITELRELFMQMSGPSNDGPEATPPDDQ